MKAFWQWLGSPAYWRFSAIFTGIFLSVSALGRTGDWMFSASMAFGFYLCWKFSAYSKQAAHGIKENNA